MQFQFVALLLIASTCGAQTPLAKPTQSSVGDSVATVTVAPGTTVALTLVSTVKSKSTKPGDAVRAVVAFPVTVGSQLAIPAGTYVEGTVSGVNARDSHTHAPSVRLHFTTLLFANGYAVPLDATNTEAMTILPGRTATATHEIADARDGAPYLGEGFASGGQQTPPTLPSLGPSPAVVTGVALGGGIGITALVLILSHRHQMNADLLLFDNGWQFQMVLTTPLTLDAGKVAAAAAMPTSH